MVNETQRSAAALVGAAYLLALPPAIFAEFYIPLQLVVRADMGATARNIIAHQSLYRLGIASSLLVFALDIGLITGLYLTLEPVNRILALLAAFVRLIETGIMVMVPLNDMALLRLVSDADAVRGIGADRLAEMIQASVGAHGGIYGTGLLFAGLGSAMFCYLWYRSRYVPRLLAAWGMLASLLLAARELGAVLSPAVGRIITIEYYGGPIFVFELAMGGWLLIKGLRRPTALL